MADVYPELPGSLNEQQALAAALFDTCGALVVVLDTEGRIALFNKACERTTGFRADEVLGTKVWDLFIPADECAGVRETFAELLGGKFPNDHANHWRCRNGEQRFIHWSNTVLCNGDGEVRWVVGTGLDITDLQRASDELLESEARMRAVLETAVDAILTIDEHGTIESFNPAAERLFGLPAADAVGRNVSMLMPSPYAENHHEYLARYLATGERRIIGIGREVVGLRRDGSTFPVELAVSEVNVTGRRVFTGVIRDITERKRAEMLARKQLSDLAHASRLATVGEMTSSIAHEINQPLAAIVSFADACLRMQNQGRADAAILSDALEQISAQASRAADVVRRLRRFTAKGELERTAVEPGAVVREVHRLMDHELTDNGVALRIELDPALPLMVVDTVQVQQVLVNLVRNAIEAMSETPAGERMIRISAEYSGGGTVEFAVEDRGRGVGEASDRVFDAFYTSKAQGMGLGLSLSRSIVEAHGGSLWVEAAAGPGATFRFTLPAGGDAGG